MFPWSNSDTSRTDPRALQRLFDRQARYLQFKAEAAQLGHNEPPFLISLATLVFVLVVVAFAAAAMP